MRRVLLNDTGGNVVVGDETTPFVVTVPYRIDGDKIELQVRPTPAGVVLRNGKSIENDWFDADAVNRIEVCREGREPMILAMRLTRLGERLSKPWRPKR